MDDLPVERVLLAGTEAAVGGSIVQPVILEDFRPSGNTFGPCVLWHFLADFGNWYDDIMTDKNHPKCWQCGGKTSRLFDSVPYFECEACDCSVYLKHDKEHLEALAGSRAFTDPAYMREWDFIDHAVVHMPSPG
jgi:hypothetical protein